MRRSLIIPAIFLAASLAASPLRAQSATDTPADNDDAPVLVEAPWAGAVIIGIAGFFLAALVIGPAVRLHAPSTHAHDEPPGTSGHHGKTGTVEENSEL